PGVALCKARASAESSRCATSSSGAAEARSGEAVSGAQPTRHGAGLGLLDFFFLCCVWLSAPMEPASKQMERARAMRREPRSSRRAAAARSASRDATTASGLTRRTGVGIVAEGVWVAFRENLHQPPIEVIHWVVHDGFETSIVLSMGFFNVIP